MSQDRASDRDQILDLIARLAHATDQGSVEEYAACFTENGSLARATGEPVKGRENLAESSRARRVAGGLGPGSGTRHFISNTSIQISNGTASAVSYVIFYRIEKTGPAPKGFSVYYDQFRRTPQGWLLSERRIQPAETVPA